MKALKIALLGLLMGAGPLLAQDAETVWIDVRSVEEYQQDHIPDTLNIPHTDVASKVPLLGLEKQTPIYVYCRSGGRSAMAKQWLEQLGYTEVTDLGGIEDARSHRKEL